VLNSFDHKRINYTLIVLFFLFAIANLSGLKQFWGGNFSWFLSPLAGILSTIIVLLSIAQVYFKKNTPLFDSDKTANTLHKYGGALFWVPFSLVMLFLFLYFPSETTLLGDGNLRVNQVDKGQFLLKTEVIDFFLHALIFKYIFDPLDLTINLCYQVYSAVCGIIYIIGLIRLSHYLNPKQSLLTFFVMFSSAMTVFFFGYIESYSLIAALLPFIILTALKIVDGQRSKTWIVIWYITAGLIHSVSIILLSGMVLVILFGLKDDNGKRSLVFTRILLSVAGIALLVLYVLHFLDLYDIRRYLMPFFPTPEFKQGIFTINYLLNLFNWSFMSALPFLFFAFAIFNKKTLKGFFSDRRMVFALWMMVPSFLFMFFFIPQLGGPRDWDLFTLAAFILIPASLIIYYRLIDTLPRVILPIVLMSLLTTGAFAAVNHSMVKATERYTEIIEVSRFKNMFKEYGTLLLHAEANPQLSNLKLKFALKAWEQPPYTRQDSILVLQKLSDTYTRMNQPDQAFYYLNMAFRVDSLEFFTNVLMIHFLNQFGGGREIVDFADVMEKRFPKHSTALTITGLIFIRGGDTARGEANLEKAITIDSSDFNSLVNYGTYMISKKNYVKAAELLNMALNVNRRSFLANYYLSVVYLELDEIEKAEQHFSKSKFFMRTDEDKQMVEELKAAIIKARASSERENVGN